MTIDPDKVFAKLEQDRSSGKLSKKVTAATTSYQASVSHPGYLEQINRENGVRRIGTFADGAFTPFSD